MEVPFKLFYDQSRGKWVGSYTVNSTNPAGIWQIQVNASDVYGNMGIGSTSTLVTIPSMPPPPQQNSTFYYILIAGLVLFGLAMLALWILYGRKRVLRKVLKVDIEAIHEEARKVENQDFFKSVQEQLKQQREETSGGSKNSSKTS